MRSTAKRIKRTPPHPKNLARGIIAFFCEATRAPEGELLQTYWYRFQDHDMDTHLEYFKKKREQLTKEVEDLTKV